MGYAVVERGSGRLRPLSIGVIRTEPAYATADRLAQIRKDLLEVIETHRPGVVAIERLFFNSNVRTAMSVGQASGVAMATAAETGLTVFDYTPPEVKQAVVGVGSATKKQVQEMVTSLLGLDAIPRWPDAADACALAICHLNRSGLRAAIGAVR
jgi:crossover junction endodeoxyribonuclease RuvC